MTTYTYDTEFLEDGKTIELISIAVVDCDHPGREYYAINAQAPWGRIERHPWLMQNVVTELDSIDTTNFTDGNGTVVDTRITGIDFKHPLMKSKLLIRRDIEAFLGVGGFLDPVWDVLPKWEQEVATPELWAYYADYDHVALCQLWGTMMDLPKGMPMYTMDIRQEMHRRLKEVRQDHMNTKAMPIMPKQADGNHDALEDARFNLVRMRKLGIA